MNTLLVGEITLEPLVVEHAEAMFTVLSDHALYRYLDYEPPPSVDHLRTVYAKQAARQSPDGTQIWLNWVARLAGEGLVGYVQATVDANRSAWIGVVFSRKARGRGHATRAVAAMLEHLSTQYGVTCFLATIEKDNARSIRLFERLGFKFARREQREGHDLAPSERLLVRTPEDRGATAAPERRPLHP